MLERPELEQLAQRVIARFHLEALLGRRRPRTTSRHRLSVAGMTRAIPFDRAALQRIHEIDARRAAAHQPAVRPRRCSAPTPTAAIRSTWR